MAVRRQAEQQIAAPVNPVAFLDRPVCSLDMMSGQFYQELGPDTEIGRLLQRLQDKTYGEIFGIFFGTNAGQINIFQFANIFFQLGKRGNLPFEIEFDPPKKPNLLAERLEALLVGQIKAVATPREYMTYIRLADHVATQDLVALSGGKAAWHQPYNSWLARQYSL